MDATRKNCARVMASVSSGQCTVARHWAGLRRSAALPTSVKKEVVALLSLGLGHREPRGDDSHHGAAPGRARMIPSSPMRRSKRTAARIFVLLFVALLVGFYFTVGTDVVGLGSVWAILGILAALVLIVALYFVT